MDKKTHLHYITEWIFTCSIFLSDNIMKIVYDNMIEPFIQNLKRHEADSWCNSISCNADIFLCR